jgi:hypothetical protein
MIARIVDGLKQRTATALAFGATLVGDGWSLTGTELKISGGGQKATVTLPEIEHASPCDGMLGVWKKGEHSPVGGIRPDSKNAPVLFAFLRDWIDFREDDAVQQSGSAAENGSLGRLLFARRRAELAQAVGVLWLILGAAGAFLVFFEDLRLYSFIAIGLSAVFFVVGLCIPIGVFRVYEHGFVQSSGRRERCVRYRDIIEFTYWLTKFHDRYGRYIGMEFEVAAKTSDTAIQFAQSRTNIDLDLQQICHDITEIVAKRMLSELQSGRAVKWLDDVTLLREGLQFRRAKTFGLTAGELQVLPYAEIAKVVDDGSQGMIYSKEKPGTAALAMSRRTPNFYPGFILLQWLAEGTAQVA